MEEVEAGKSMATLYTNQSKNIRKTWFLMTAVFLLIITIGLIFSRIYGNPSILFFFVLFSIVLNVFSYWYSDKIVLKMHRAREVKREENFDLWNVTENLSITAGLPMPRLFTIEDDSPNAFATGRDSKHAVVVVTTGLLKILDKNELEGVIAHELSHIGNRDMLLSTTVVVLVGFITLISDFFLRSARFGFGRDRDRSDGQGILFLIGIVLAILSPIFATLIQLAVSRKREFLADSSGALLTRYPEGLANALRKISQSNIPLRSANKATAHLFISNPFKFSNVGKLLSTHPPVEERIRALIGNDIK